MRRQTVISIAVAVALTLGPLGVSTVGQSAATESVSSSGIASEQNVQLDVTVHWDSDVPDRVQYVYSFDASSDSEFVLEIDETIDSISGFTQNGNGNWEYDPNADAHRVTITQSVTESASHHDWVYSSDSGAMVGAPHLTIRWNAGGYITEENPLRDDYSNVAVTFDGHSGFREFRRIYVGPYTTYSTTYDGHTYTIYRPALADGSDSAYEGAARLVASTADFMAIDDGLAHAEFVVFPAGESSNDAVHTYSESSWAGMTYSSAPEAIVKDSSHYDSYSNVWAHEYVHIEQEFADGAETDWLREAHAEYVTAMNTHRVGCGYGDFQSFLEADGSTQDDTLSDRSTWEPATPYEKGLATLADFSARLHAQTDGRLTATDIFATMEDTEVRTHDAFVRKVNETVNDDASNTKNARYLDRYATTSDYPGDSNIDHPPVDRASSCLANYQHLEVTKTTYDGGSETTPTPTATATPTPDATATPTPDSTPTPNSTPTPDSTATPTPTPDSGGGGNGGDGSGGGGGGGSGGNDAVSSWVNYARSWIESCGMDGGSVSCGV